MYANKKIDYVEEEYRRLVDLSPEAIAIHTLGKIVYINHSGVKLIGAQSSEELIGKDILGFVHPDFVEKVIERVKFIYTHNLPTDILEEKLIRTDGKIIDAEVVSMPFLFHGKPSVQLILRDITKRKEQEAKQLFLEKISDELFNAFDDSMTLQLIAKQIVPHLADYCRIAVLDVKGNVNEIAINHKDPTKIQLVSDLYDSYKDSPTATHGVPKILQTGMPEMISIINDDFLKAFAVQTQMINIIKQIGLKSYIGVPLIARKKIIGAMSISSVQKGRYYTNDDFIFMQEVGRRVAIALDNSRLYQNAQNAITIRDEFISVASHELKTPVTSIKAFAQVLQNKFKKNNDVESFKLLTKVNTQIDKLVVLIQDLLDVSKIEEGKLEYNETEFYIDELIKEVVEELQRTTENHNIDCITGEKLLIKADKDRIGQVLTNLITNAIKFSTDNKKIIVKTKHTNKNVVVSVQDFGIGIPQEKQDRIFERFFQITGRNNVRHSSSGLGLGLYISSKIIHQHKGKIWVKSIEGKGSTFYISLPINK